LVLHPCESITQSAEEFISSALNTGVKKSNRNLILSKKIEIVS